jgi:hypothetical protein
MSATSFMQLSMVAGEQNPGLVAEHHVNQKFLKARSLSSNHATGPLDPIGPTA